MSVRTHRDCCKIISFYAPSNPNANYFYIVQNGLTSDYDALQIQFRRRLSQGLTVLAPTRGRTVLTMAPRTTTLDTSAGIATSTSGTIFRLPFPMSLPNVGHSGFTKAVLHHWGLDDRFTARTSFPVTLNGNPLLEPNGQTYYAGLNLFRASQSICTVPIARILFAGWVILLLGQTCPGGRAINPLAFTVASSGLGDAPRNFARGFGAWQWILAIRQEFPIHERLKLQFRAEAFNIFNHPNFGIINSTLCSGTGCTFGQATATLASSLGVLSPLYQQGGPRSMQFALKLIF